MFCTRCIRASRQLPLRAVTRTISTTSPFRSAAEAPAQPILSTPVTAPGEKPQEPAAPISSCPEGTVISGLNYLKDGTDPVTMKDEDYPPWLWDCLDVMKKASEEDGLDDEFSKSKKKRKAALRKKRAMEAEIMAGGDLEALAPKVPIPEQSINLPGKEGSSLEENLEALKARDELTRAMRVDRKAKIKERNFLKSM